jgi:sulfate adenylyltransferase
MHQRQIAPHGGVLVNRVADDARRAELARETKSLPSIPLTDEQADDVWNIANGLFSPLTGFMSREELESVVERRRLPSGAAWTLPILLDVESAQAPGRIALTHRGEPIAILDAKAPFEFDRPRMAKAVFGTDDPHHPGVAHTLSLKPRFVGGALELLREPESPFAKQRLTPARTREAFRTANLTTVAAFQTRNPPHIAHEFLQKLALNHCDGLFINPVIGKKKAGDFRDDVILGCYEVLREKFHPKGRVFLGTLHTWMRYAGPMEAIFHGIVRQNFGCTHLIVGRDHAGVGGYYPPFAAQEIFAEFPDLQIHPLKYPAAFYCRACAMYTTSTTCPHGPEQQVNVSGTQIRKAIQEGGKLEYTIRDEILDVIRTFEKPFVE